VGRDRPDPFWDAGASFVVKPATADTFSNFRSDLFEIFRRESLYKQENFRDEPKKSIRPGAIKRKKL